MQLKVASHSAPKALAGAVSGLLRESPQVELQAVGPQAVNQAVKALAIARGYLEGDGIDLIVQPAFAPAKQGGVQMLLLVTAIRRL
ncbi:MAG: stage V sporulation protein S [Deinococcus sp.]|nr:stage V sporulation protein S [Deinococcus sp.]